jgi:ankyrin repeat protein
MELTSLHLASLKGHKEVIELLLKRGAHVDKIDMVIISTRSHKLALYRRVHAALLCDAIHVNNHEMFQYQQDLLGSLTVREFPNI